MGSTKSLQQRFLLCCNYKKDNNDIYDAYFLGLFCQKGVASNPLICQEGPGLPYDQSDGPLTYGCKSRSQTSWATECSGPGWPW